MKVLALDTEPATVSSLRGYGFNVTAADLGYRTGQPNLNVPPHEFDALVCDLKIPTVYKALLSGTDYAGPQFFHGVPPNEALWFKDSDGISPIFRLIEETELKERGLGIFSYIHVFRAVELAGMPMLLMMNSGWMQHVHNHSSFFGLRWMFRRTSASEVTVHPVLRELLSGTAVRIKTPLRYAIEWTPVLRGPKSGADRILSARPLVMNSVGETFGQLIRMGKGAIWALPEAEDNPSLLVGALGKLSLLRTLPGKYPEADNQRGNEGVQMEGPADSDQERVDDQEAPEERDLFVCHASEDKSEFVRPLVDELIKHGVTVWYDEFELKIGDRLRRTIERGILQSKHGLVVLSHKFFLKDWPRDELDAIANLAKRGTKILPIWHGLTQQDVSSYSPLLADLYAARSSIGIEGVAGEILRALDQSISRGASSKGSI